MMLATVLVMGVLAGLAGCGGDARSVPVLGTLRAQYRFDRPPPDGLTALLDRPSESTVCVAEVIGHDDTVKILASGSRYGGAGPPSVLGPTDITLVDDAAKAEVRVLDADRDGDDEMLIRARALDLTGMWPAPGTGWRERVWIADDCSGSVRQIVDVALPLMQPVLATVESMWNVRGHGESLAIVVVTGVPGYFSYVVDEQLAARPEPCRDVSCLPIVEQGGNPIVGYEFSAWQGGDGTLAVVNVNVRETGHLEAEDYLERRDCARAASRYECEPAADWGLVTRALGRGFLADERAVSYLRATWFPETLQSWRSPSDSTANNFEAGGVVWATTEGESVWRLGAMTRDGLFLAEQDPAGARFTGRYEVEGWAPRQPGAWAEELYVNPEREHAFVMLTDLDVDHQLVVEIPQQ